MSAEEFVPTNERLLRYLGSLGHKPITLVAVLDPCSPYVCWTKRIPACCLTGLHVWSLFMQTQSPFTLKRHTHQEAWVEKNSGIYWSVASPTANCIKRSLYHYQHLHPYLEYEPRRLHHYRLFGYVRCRKWERTDGQTSLLPYIGRSRSSLQNILTHTLEPQLSSFFVLTIRIFRWSHPKIPPLSNWCYW